jgi:hypothetical protein
MPRKLTPAMVARLGKGRPKGVPNKTPALLKDVILKALDKAGGVEYLVWLAQRHPSVVAPLLGRVLPLQVTTGGAEPTMPTLVIHEHRGPDVRT